MTAQTENIDFYLIKIATMLSALLLGNYVLWSLNAPVIYKTILVIVMFAVIGYFLIKPPFKEYWPIKIFIISIVLISLGSPSKEWDARSIWLFHAKRIFFDNNLYAQLDGYCGWSHNDYPVLIPALSASLAKIIGYWNEVFPKLSSILAFIPAILLLSSVLKHRFKQLLLCNLLLFILYKHFISGYMDGILAIYFTAASLLIYLLTAPAGERLDLNSNQRLWLYLSSFFVFSSLTLIKNEGLVLFVVLVSAAFLTRIIFRKTRITATIIIIFLVSLAPIAIWKIVCAKSGVNNDLAGLNLTTQLMGRVFLIGAYLKIVAALVLNSRVYLPLILFIFVAKDLKYRTGVIFIAFSSLLYFCILFAVYLSTPAELVWHLNTSASRTISPIGLILGFYALLFFKIEKLQSEPHMV